MITNKLYKNRWLKILINTLIITFTLVTLPYYFAKIYDFSEPEPFMGNFFYNPYANISSNWVKANFHAHSRSFGGLAKGQNSGDELIERYNSLGYDLICISNYNRTTQKNKSQQLYIPVYEHGFNINWTHQLSISSKKTCFFDFPLLQWLSHKQLIINTLKQKGALVALTHPSFKNSYSPDDLKYLTNYDFIEGISPVATSVRAWDDALTNGHAVWVMGNDDAHGISDGSNGVCWTMINTDSLSGESITKSLQQGNFYATRGWLGQEMNRIISVTVTGNTYELLLEKASDSIILKSNWGQTVKSETGKNKISYDIKPSDSYIRAEIYDTEPWNGYTRIYLNPVIRTPEGSLIKHNNIAGINVIKTISFVLLLLVLHAFGLYILYVINFKKDKKTSQADNKPKN
ncbi:MAG TPA: hypothetical protein PLE11_09750 [Bacteroidales bacterium]|nr:hypothetical protein [Bacteroidales bacterium]HNZ44191.1 hypothetical protein [Bacteroidales bacterium]HPB26031.1 hypothetical protein [Bacteroidales bacterium]HPI30463.1 hypothetical protein [Bacteroidales bacterium]